MAVDKMRPKVTPQVEEPLTEALDIQLRTWDQVALHIIGQEAVEVLIILLPAPSHMEEPVVLEVAGAVLLLLAPEA